MTEQPAKEPSVLFVDDEEKILHAVERVFLGSDLHIRCIGTPGEALALMESEEVAVVVSDQQMPEMSGSELLDRVRERSPQTVRILMTGYADLATAVEAINRNEVYRFILKPWDNDELLKAVRSGVARHQTLSALHREDEAILRSLAQTIELKDPYTRGHCDRVAKYAVLIGTALGLAPAMLGDIRYGGWLHDCGKIGVPEAILNFAGKLSNNDFDTVKKHPLWGAEVARQARLSEVVVNIIQYHHEHFDGSGYPYGLAGGRIPLEARIVAVADVYDALTTDRPYRQGSLPAQAMTVLRSLQGTLLDPELVGLFTELNRNDSAATGDARAEGEGHD
jgi:putative nucleotidyltransferase with HDIG domain